MAENKKVERPTDVVEIVVSEHKVKKLEYLKPGSYQVSRDTANVLIEKKVAKLA